MLIRVDDDILNAAASSNILNNKFQSFIEKFEEKGNLDES